MQRISGWAEVGGATVITAGTDSVTDAQQSFPGCTVTVFDSGTTSLSSIFSDDGITPTANPFLSGDDASWGFYVAIGQYDIRFSGIGIDNPFSISAINVTGFATPLDIGSTVVARDGSGNFAAGVVTVSNLTGSGTGPWITALPTALNNNFGIQSGNSYGGVGLSAGSSGMAAATGVPFTNMQVHSRPNATAGVTDVNYGFYSYRHGTNAANDGNSYATAALQSAIESDSTATPQASLYHDIIAGQFIATAKANSTTAAFGLNVASFLATTTGFANGCEIDIYNYSGGAAVALTNGSAAYGQTQALSLVSGINGGGSVNNSSALTIAVSGGFPAAFLTGIRFGASATKDYGIDMFNVGTGSSTAVPIRLGNNTFIKARNTLDTLDRQLIGFDNNDKTLIGDTATPTILQGASTLITPRTFIGPPSEVFAIGLAYSPTRAVAGEAFYLGATDSGTPDLVLSAAGGAETGRMTNAGNLKVGGTASRGTTEGTKQLVIFNGTAPVGTLTNGVTLYSSGGKLFAMDAAGAATQLTP